MQKTAPSGETGKRKKLRRGKGSMKRRKKKTVACGKNEIFRKGALMF